MQLAIILALFLMASKNNFTQIKPIIEEFGGEEGKLVIKQAEELNQMISAIQTFKPAKQSNGQQPLKEDNQPIETEQAVQDTYPLDPIKSIADEKTLSALSRYVALGE